MTLHTLQPVDPALIKIRMDKQQYFPAGDGDIVKTNSSKTDKEKTRLAKEILTRLNHLHQHNIIQERIHPGNALSDDGETAELCDARLYTAITSDENERNFLPWKCWWMPPEQLIAKRVDDDTCVLGLPSKAANIYGVALTITQLWTLQRPFSRMRNGCQLIAMFHNLDLRDVAHVYRPVQVPEEVWRALRGCLSIDPEARPTAEELLKRFEALVAEGDAS